jgi:hypothetical protein
MYLRPLDSISDRARVPPKFSLIFQRLVETAARLRGLGLPWDHLLVLRARLRSTLRSCYQHGYSATLPAEIGRNLPPECVLLRAWRHGNETMERSWSNFVY